MKDNGRNAISCPKHPKQRAATMFVKFGRSIKKKFSDYQEASRFLNGLRFKVDENSFDPRDYQKSNPLGFRTLADKWLDYKRDEISHGSFQSLRPLVGRAIERFANVNVKEIRFAELQDFLRDLRKNSGLSGKTIHNLFSHLHNFWVWLVDREEIRSDQMPKFPEIHYEMGWRKTTDKDTQELILSEIWNLCRDKTPRAYFAILLCSSNVNIRPGELSGVLEEDVDLDRKCIWIREHKTKRHTQAPKTIALLDEDLEFIKGLPRGFPKMPFFRRDKGGGGRHANTPFGQHYLISVWNRACQNLGIEGVGLYGGTRHTTCQYLRQQGKTPEEVKRYTDHTTNKAFDRYLQVEIEEKREGVQLARGNKMRATKTKDPGEA
jgi:integrase